MEQSEFQEKVEKIIENVCKNKILNNEQYLIEKKLMPKNAEQLALLNDWEQMDKQFQKNVLINQIINSQEEIINYEVQHVQDQFDQQIQNLENSIAQVKELVLKIMKDSMTITCETLPQQIIFQKQVSSQILEDKPVSNKDLSDKNSKQLMKKLSDVEKDLTQRIQHTDNLLSILMDNQVATKTAIQDLQKGGNQIQILEQVKSQPSNSHTMSDEQLSVYQAQLEKKIDARMNDVKKIAEDSSNYSKGFNKKLYFYWKVVNDLREGHDRLRKEFDDVVNQLKSHKTGLLRKTNLIN